LGDLGKDLRIGRVDELPHSTSARPSLTINMNAGGHLNSSIWDAPESVTPDSPDAKFPIT
jgi:hypothetical protein